MNGVNKVILVGTLGADPKNVTSKEGKTFTSLSLATNRYWRNKEGTLERKTDWHRVAVWGKKGSLCEQHLKKGSPVCIDGYLSNYEIDEDGTKRWMTSITAYDVEFIPKTKQDSH